MSPARLQIRSKRLRLTAHLLRSPENLVIQRRVGYRPPQTGLPHLRPHALPRLVDPYHPTQSASGGPNVVEEEGAIGLVDAPLSAAEYQRAELESDVCGC